MPKIGELPIKNDFSMGIDIGIGSAAVAVIGPSAIKRLYVHCFPVPETADKKELLNAIRRGHRLARRQTRRRRQRRNETARVLCRHLPLSLADIKARDVFDPWQARAKGLTERLEPLEFAAALMHIAKRRGFRSNSKKVASSNDPEGGKALRGISEMTEKAQRYTTVGEMLFVDPEFTAKKRNRPDDYSHTVSRQSTREEIVELFKKQRDLGASFASENLMKEFLGVAYFQRPLQASESLVGGCPFEPGQKRSPSFAPSFERFRYLSKLNTLTIIDGAGPGRRLEEGERQAAAALFGTKKSITYKDLRKAMGLPDVAAFNGVPGEKPAKGSLWEGVDICRSVGTCATFPCMMGP